MSTIRNILILAVAMVLLKDIIVKIPGFLVGSIDTIGRMPAKMVAIVILIVTGIVFLVKKKK
ncbi:MAG: hypothetical protein IJ220_05665 [Clostridia bacterium]|nr:hypothetical protein [Clostridia bacterium]